MVATEWINAVCAGEAVGSVDWYDRMGWIWVLDSECGLWMAGGRSRLLGAAVIVGLERVKPAVVVSQRAFLLLFMLYSLDDRPPVVALQLSNERGVSSGRGRR